MPTLSSRGPLMVRLLRRINDVLYNPANLGVPKHILIEEIFSSMKNKQLFIGQHRSSHCSV
jgi:type IV secretion system protein VirB4